MLTWIVTHSEPLCKFLKPLLAGFTPAQERHTLNFIEALLVCAAKHKTLAALTRLLQVPHADEYALADFFRASPWPAGALRLSQPGPGVRTQRWSGGRRRDLSGGRSGSRLKPMARAPT